MELAKTGDENLSDAEITRRLRVGIVMLMVALALAAIFERFGVSTWNRLWLFAPFFLAENAFFQAVHKTCGFSALRGIRHSEDGDERIADPKVRQACQCRGKAQILHSVLSAAALTGLFIWIG